MISDNDCMMTIQTCENNDDYEQRQWLHRVSADISNNDDDDDDDDNSDIDDIVDGNDDIVTISKLAIIQIGKNIQTKVFLQKIDYITQTIL